MTRHKMVLSIVLVLLVVLPSRLVAAWMTIHNHGHFNIPSSCARQRLVKVGNRAVVCLYGTVEAISLQTLDDHASEGEQLAKSIAAWLDAEVRPILFFLVPTDESNTCAVNRMLSLSPVLRLFYCLLSPSI
jgi:hypothetical protein